VWNLRDLWIPRFYLRAVMKMYGWRVANGFRGGAQIRRFGASVPEPPNIPTPPKIPPLPVGMSDRGG